MSRPRGKEATNAAQTRNHPEKVSTPASVMRPRALLIVSVLLLLLIGLVMIYSASSVESMTEMGDSAYYLKKQIALLATGVIFCVIAAKIPYRAWLTKICWVPWLLVVLLLLATAIGGTIGLGAKRWIDIPGLGTFQPSEFAKIAVILLYAELLTEYHEGVIDVKSFALTCGVVIIVPVALIVYQPDLGTTIILICSAILALWFGEVDFRPILWALLIVCIIGVFFVVTSPYRMERVMTFVDPEADPLGNGYQTLNSLYAFGEGGFFGVGLGNSYQKYSYLPEAHTDFIFSIIGEELGFLGAIVVIALFLVFLYAGIKIAHDAPTLQGKILAGSSCTVIVLQAFLNMACSVGLFPVTGKPLPFVSYGGSSLWASLLLVGLILSVSLSWQTGSESERRRNDMRVIEGGATARAAADKRVASKARATASVAAVKPPARVGEAARGAAAPKRKTAVKPPKADALGTKASRTETSGAGSARQKGGGRRSAAPTKASATSTRAGTTRKEGAADTGAARTSGQQRRHGEIELARNEPRKGDRR